MTVTTALVSKFSGVSKTLFEGFDPVTEITQEEAMKSVKEFIANGPGAKSSRTQKAVKMRKEIKSIFGAQDKPKRTVKKKPTVVKKEAVVEDAPIATPAPHSTQSFTIISDGNNFATITMEGALTKNAIDFAISELKKRAV